MKYPKIFFEIQLKFAEKAAELTGDNIDNVLLDYTSFYKFFGIPGWKFDEKNVVWQEFLKRFENSKNKLDTLYNFYLEKGEIKEDANKKYFGCFSYEFEEKDNCISLHFRNADISGFGPLSKERMETRKIELREMFQDIKINFPKVKEVCVFTWLNDVKSFTRLFPLEYGNDYEIITSWFKSMAIWGQFFDHTGKLKKDMVQEFLSNVRKAKTLEELKDSFPLKLIEVSAAIKYFNDFYDVK